MPGLVPDIHVFSHVLNNDVDGRVKPAMTEKSAKIPCSRFAWPGMRGLKAL
jgi:hypothetical protein